MSFSNGLSLEASARIFAMLTLKSDAVAAFVQDGRFATSGIDAAAPPTPLSEDDLRAQLTGEIPSQQVECFLSALRSGRLQQCVYSAVDGGFRVSRDGAPSVFLPREDVLVGMNPLSEDLKGPRPRSRDGSVALTRGMIHLHSLWNIPSEAFEEAAFRALGHRSAERDDLLWLHADEGELRRLLITRPLKLASKPPAVDVPNDYGRRSRRFPMVTLEFSGKIWAMKEQYVYGSLPLREVVLSALVQAPWPLTFVPREKGPSKSPPALPVPRTAAKRTVRPRSSPVSDFFSQFDLPRSPLDRRVVAITKPGVLIQDLEDIPRGVFEKAAVWALGGIPAPGDRLVFTSGPCFRKKERVRDCLVLCRDLPRSRLGREFPKVWMAFRKGRWEVLPEEIQGEGAEALLEALASRTAWGIIF